MDVVLWRGLTFDSRYSSSLELMRKDILENGDRREDRFNLLVPNISHHNMDVTSIVDNILKLEKPIVRYNDKCAKCVSGDIFGAQFYATREHDPGIIIKLKTDIERIVIDGRDFLYTIIPMAIRNGISRELLNLLSQAFGEKIEDYITAGSKLVGCESDFFFKYIDYICMDTDIINAHIKNENVLIKGRHSTEFKSAFGVIDGIQANDVLEIIQANQFVNNERNHKISIDDFRL